jgi:hypothetical protein
VQASHAAIEHAYQFGRPIDHHPSYIHLTVRDLPSLLRIRASLNFENIRTAEFHEPYKDWGLTAIACCLSEEEREHLKGLQLWKLPTQEGALA